MRTQLERQCGARSVELESAKSLVFALQQQVDAAAADRERRSAEHWQADCEQKRAHEEAVGRLEKQITALLGDHERVLGALRAEQSTQLRYSTVANHLCFCDCLGRGNK